jgi:anti-sigma-K factor RskA
MSHQAVGWALHALEPDEESGFPEHVATCGHCRRTVRETEQTLALLGADVEQVEPPASLHAGIMDAIARTPQEPRPARPPRPDPRPHRLVAQDAAGPRPVRRFGLGPRGRRIVAAKVGVAAVLAIVVLGVQNAQLGAERDATAAQAAGLTQLLQQLGSSGTEHAILATPDGTATAAVVVVNGSTRQVYGLGLPANDADHTYVLWGVNEGAVPAPLGAFDVIPSSPAAVSVGSAPQAEGFAQYAISIEPGRVAPASPTVVVASGQVAL